MINIVKGVLKLKTKTVKSPQNRQHQFIWQKKKKGGEATWSKDIFLCLRRNLVVKLMV